MEANDYQIGGDHYKAEYQHWNWVDDIGLHYYLGNATKYITRWQKKNGAQDLRKALHYIVKAEERNVYPNIAAEQFQNIGKFCNQFDDFTANCIYILMDCRYDEVQKMLSNKISELELQEQK